MYILLIQNLSVQLSNTITATEPRWFLFNKIYTNYLVDGLLKIIMQFIIFKNKRSNII